MRTARVLAPLLLLAATVVAARTIHGPEPAPAAPTASAATLMLTIALDAAGVRVLQAMRKPALAFRLPADHEAFPLHWTLRDQGGAVLAAGASDPGPVCLDPAHAGQPGHVQGDIAIPHELCTNVKVPDLGERLHRVEFSWRGPEPRALGVLDRAALGLR